MHRAAESSGNPFIELVSAVDEEGAFGFPGESREARNPIVSINLRIHAITEVNVKQGYFVVDCRLEALWTDTSPGVLAREALYQQAKQLCDGNPEARLALASGQDRYEWNNGKPIQDNAGVQVEWPGHTRTVVLKNAISSEPTYEPYLTHYVGGALATPSGHNARYIERSTYKLRMTGCSLRDFPFDHHILAFEFRLPRTADKGCRLEFNCGISFDDGNEKKAAGAGLKIDAFTMPGWRIFYSKLDANRKVVPKDCASIPATGPVSELAFTLWASRRPEQYYQFFFLTFIFGVAPAYTHSIPLDLPAERGSVTFLLMLTIITFNFLISDEIPKVSHVVFLDAYMKVTFILGQTVIVENAVIGATPNGQQAEIDQYFYLSFAAVYGLVTMLAILKIFKLMDPKCFGPRVGQVVGS